MWTQRTIVGYGGPEDTREGVEAAIAAGNTGFDVVSDVPTGQAMDPDHPVLGPDVGLEGCSLPTRHDLDVLTAGIDLTQTDVAGAGAPLPQRLPLRLLEKIEEIGIVKAVTDDVIERWCEDSEMASMREMEDGERIVVGVNALVKESEPDPQRFTVEPWRVERHLKRFAQTAGDPDLLQRRMDDVRTVVRTGNEWHEALVRAFLADATIGETWGTLRVTAGYPYDAFGALESPFGHTP